MRTAFVLTALLCLSAPVLGAVSFEGVGDVDGRAIVGFTPTAAGGTFGGTITLTGEIVEGGERVRFTASGDVIGSANIDLATLEGWVWSTMLALGTLETGEPIDIRGGFTVESETASYFLGAEVSGQARGPFALIVATRGRLLDVRGTFEGALAGGFLPAPPDDPTKMQLTLTGQIAMTGERVQQLDSLASVSAEDLAETLSGSGMFPMELSSQLSVLLLNVPELDGDPGSPNGAQVGADATGDEDGCDDDDHDGVPNVDDNCLLTANPDQADSDGDGTGDLCDEDLDGDGVENGDDNCPLVANPDQADLDGDGVGDVCEPETGPADIAAS